jgi:hypothetical protein
MSSDNSCSVAVVLESLHSARITKTVFVPLAVICWPSEALPGLRPNLNLKLTLLGVE